MTIKISVYSNHLNVPDGLHTLQEFCDLLRVYAYHPDAVRFLADALEGLEPTAEEEDPSA